MKKTWIAVLHLKYRNPTNIYQLAGKVYANMSANITMFGNQETTLTELKKQNDELLKRISSNDGTENAQLDIDTQTDTVFDLLKDLIYTVNKIAKGNKSIIVFSGFDYNDEPAEHAIPDKPIIRKAVDGKTKCSIKLFVEAQINADRYRVETTTTPLDPTSWKEALEASRNNLELKDQTYAKEVHLRVLAGNTHGWSIPSDTVVFVPR